MLHGEFTSPMQRCFSDDLSTILVTSYVIDAYLCLAMLPAWTLEYQHDAPRLMVDTCEGRKASWRRPPCRALATSGSTKFRRMPTNIRCGDLRLPGVTERSNGHSDYATMMMVMMTMTMKDVRRVNLNFKGSPESGLGRKRKNKTK